VEGEVGRWVVVRGMESGEGVEWVKTGWSKRSKRGIEVTGIVSDGRWKMGGDKRNGGYPIRV
jgi:hypothetical protein